MCKKQRKLKIKVTFEIPVNVTLVSLPGEHFCFQTKHFKRDTLLGFGVKVCGCVCAKRFK